LTRRDAVIAARWQWRVPTVLRAGLVAGLVACLAVPGMAADRLGPVTSLPLPRFVSLKAGEANVRRGPSLTHRVDWVFRHPGTPLVVVNEYGHWRRVVDRDGMGGWVHYALLSGNRTVIVDAEEALIRMKPLPDAPVTARAERGVIARLGDCRTGWCRITADGQRGWVRQDALWGVDAPPGAPNGAETPPE